MLEPILPNAYRMPAAHLRQLHDAERFLTSDTPGSQWIEVVVGERRPTKVAYVDGPLRNDSRGEAALTVQEILKLAHNDTVRLLDALRILHTQEET